MLYTLYSYTYKKVYLIDSTNTECLAAPQQKRGHLFIYLIKSEAIYSTYQYIVWISSYYGLIFEVQIADLNSLTISIPKCTLRLNFIIFL